MPLRMGPSRETTRLVTTQFPEGCTAEWKEAKPDLTNLALVRGSRVRTLGVRQAKLPEKRMLSADVLLGYAQNARQPALGRAISRQADDSPAASGTTVLLSWGLWKRRFGGDPDILNPTIYLGAPSPTRLIGIMRSAWFIFPDPSVQLWTSFVLPRQVTEEQMACRSACTRLAWWGGLGRGAPQRRAQPT